MSSRNPFLDQEQADKGRRASGEARRVPKYPVDRNCLNYKVLEDRSPPEATKAYQYKYLVECTRCGAQHVVSHRSLQERDKNHRTRNGECPADKKTPACGSCLNDYLRKRTKARPASKKDSTLSGDDLMKAWPVPGGAK